MIEAASYNELKGKYGKAASWTMWSQPDEGFPKSNMRSLEVFDDLDLLNKINTGFVFVGLNGSGVHPDNCMEINKPWHCFHSSYAHGNDYKLRFALMGTCFWGSYITDIIKSIQNPNANNVLSYVRQHPAEMTENIEKLKDELRLIGGKPVLITLGNASFQLTSRYFGNDYEIVKIKHYADYVSKENYKAAVHNTLQPYMTNNSI